MEEIKKSQLNINPIYAFLSIAFVFLLFFLVLVYFELAVRIHITTASNIVDHPILNHVWTPNFEQKHEEWWYVDIPSYVHHYNKQSWIENYDVALEKPNSTFRIFYVGDSFTEGTCRMDRTMPSVVEKYLREAFKKKKLDVEVINTGTSSYSPMIYYLLIKDVILRYSPDLIVIDVDMTDTRDDAYYHLIAEYGPDGELLACPPRKRISKDNILTMKGLVKKPLVVRMSEYLRSNIRLLAFVDTWIFQIRRKLGVKVKKLLGLKMRKYPEASSWLAAEWSEVTEENVKRTMERLRAIIRLTKATHVKLIITGVPQLGHFLKSEGTDGTHFSLRPLQELKNLCQEEGIPYLDSYEGLRKKLGQSHPIDYYIPSDYHFNEKGYALWAKVQKEFLLDPKNKILPPQVLDKK